LELRSRGESIEEVFIFVWCSKKCLEGAVKIVSPVLASRVVVLQRRDSGRCHPGEAVTVSERVHRRRGRGHLISIYDTTSAFDTGEYRLTFPLAELRSRALK
jgi:hypothetical protein